METLQTLAILSALAVLVGFWFSPYEIKINEED